MFFFPILVFLFLKDLLKLEPWYEIFRVNRYIEWVLLEHKILHQAAAIRCVAVKSLAKLQNTQIMDYAESGNSVTTMLFYIHFKSICCYLVFLLSNVQHVYKIKKYRRHAVQ